VRRAGGWGRDAATTAPPTPAEVHGPPPAGPCPAGRLRPPAPTPTPSPSPRPAGAYPHGVTEILSMALTEEFHVRAPTRVPG
jgi:hypothetical protein